MIWVEDDDFFEQWALREVWTPFQAACLFFSVCPPANGSDDVEQIGVSLNDDRVENSLPEVNPRSYMPYLARDLLGLAAAIRDNNKGKPGVDTTQVTQWAIKRRVIHDGHPLVAAMRGRRFEFQVPDQVPTDAGNLHLALLEDEKASRIAVEKDRDEMRSRLEAELGSERSHLSELERNCESLNLELTKVKEEKDALLSKAKQTGKHFAETRVRVLAAAIQQLDLDHDGKLRDDKGNIVAAKLAREIDDHRSRYGFPSEDKRPSHSAILKYIRDAQAGRALSDEE